MNSVETVLLENVYKPDSLFIFPTDVAASRWADHLLRLLNGGTVAMEKFIAWDTFKQNSIRSKVQNRKSVPAVLRKMFIAALIQENAELCSDALCVQNKEPVFTSFIQPAWAHQVDSYVGWLAGILSQLGIWFRQATGLSIAQIGENNGLTAGKDFSGDDRDMFNLALRYTQFLKKNGLFEPAWETPPFEDTGKECFIFFPESLTDFDEYRDLLAASPHVKTIQADRGGSADGSQDVFFYTNARSEITEAALYIIALRENQKVPWEAISVSIPDTGNYGPYVFREFDNRNIPYVKQSGKPLASYPGGQFFAAVAGCSSENFSFASITALLLNRHLPWKDDEKIQALIQFGIDNNCICSWIEEEAPSKGGEKKINVWEDAFESHAKEGAPSSDYAWLYTFFKKLTLMTNAMRYADSFSAVRKHYFAFRGSFFDMEKCLDETDLVLSRCIAELGYLVEIENSYPDMRVPDPYKFFTDYLEETSYLAQQSNSGVAILPYRTAAPVPFDCHIVLGANQDSLSAVFSFLSFLPRSKREKLGINDNDASQAFITLHCYNSRLPAAFFCSEQTFSNYAIPHSALKAELIPRQRYRDDPEFSVKFAPDLYHEESKLYSSLYFPELGKTEPSSGLPSGSLSKIHANQKQGFSEWLLRRKRTNTEGNTAGDSGISHPFVEHIRNRFLYKGDDKGLEDKYGVSSSSLELYFKCPLQFIFSRVLKLKNVEIETSLMANETAGLVYHKIINLFLEELKEKGEVIAPPSFEGAPSSGYILPKPYRDILIKKTERVFNSFPCLSDNVDDKPAMSMLTARLLWAEKELFFTQLENFLIKFISFFTGFSIVASEGRYTLDKKFYYLNGYIDCVLEKQDSENQGSLVIVDFKTKYMPTLSDCVELADFQLPMYIRLAENEFGKKTDAALFFSILDARPEVLFGVIQDPLSGETIPKKEQDRIMHGSDEYERIMSEFDKKAEQFAAEISNGTFAFSPSHWELCQECGYNRVCRTLYKVFQGEKQWNQAKKK
jgi:RecB family exonuclease